MTIHKYAQSKQQKLKKIGKRTQTKTNGPKAMHTHTHTHLHLPGTPGSLSLLVIPKHISKTRKKNDQS